MKYAIISLFSLAWFYSCLLAPLPSKEKIKPAGYSGVVIAGDLRSRLEKSKAALEAQIGDPARLFTPDTVNGTAQRVGDALLGSILLCAATGKDDGPAEKIYGLLAGNLNTAGYLGGILRGEADEVQLAGHARLIRALCEYYRWKGESPALDMAQAICDSLFVPVMDLLKEYPGTEVPRVNLYFSDGGGEGESLAGTVPEPLAIAGTVRSGNWTLCPKYGEVFTAIDALAQLYGYRKNSATREVIDRLIELYKEVREDFPGRGTSGYLSAIRGMLRYDAANGESDYDQGAAKAWELFAGESLNDMYGSGRATPEGFGIVCPADASDAFIAAMCLWEESGKGEYLQQAEKIFYNSVAPSQTAAGTFTCLLSDTLDGRLSRYTGDAYGGPAAWVEALPFAVGYSYFIRDNKILIPMYFEGELVLEDKKVRLAQRTGYPLDSTVVLEVVEAPNRGIGLQLYFPSYMSAKSIRRNGSESLSGTVNNIGLLGMREVYRKGDVIEFSYAYAPKWAETSSGSDDDSDIYRPVYGPLLLGYRGGEMMWLQRGVPLRSDGFGGFALNPEFAFSQDTVSRAVMVNDPKYGVPFVPPILAPIYEHIENYGPEDILPEYFLVRIGKE